MIFTEATAIFTLYSNNFKVIHWAACGKKFDRIHKLAEEYYVMINDDLDVLAEMGIRVNQNPAVMIKCTDIISNIDYHDFLVIEEYDNIDYNKFCTMSNIMLKDICFCIESLLENDEVKKPSNIGIKASLEGLHDKYDLQARYLNASRSIDD